MNLLEMLTQKRTDPLSSFVAREKMIRRNPMKFVGDTATRLGGGDPDASVLDLVVDHETTPRTPGLIVESPDTGKKGNGKLKGAITDIGGMLASALSPEQKTPLQFAPMQRQEFMPIADPRFLKYAGGRKKGGSVPVGSYVKVHDDEKVLNLGDGDVEVVPKGDEPKIQTLGGTIEVPIEETQESFKPPQKEDTSHSMGTPQEMEEPVKQSIADTLRGRIEEIQGRDYSKTKNEDGTTIYGKNYDKKRNWKDALRSAGYGLLQSLASAPPTNDLGSLLGRAIGGAGTGAVLGATMDNVDEKMRDQFKLAQLIPQYQNQMAMQKSQQEQALLEARRINELAKPTDRDLDRLQKERAAQAVSERAKMNIEFRQGIAKPYIDENGKVWKQYLNDPKRQLEPLVNPITGEQEFVPGEQGITWTDPNTKQSYTIKAKQSLVPSVGIATGNANRQTDADKFNTQKYWETEKENINNQMKWMSDIKALTTAAITADSGVTDDPGIRAQMDAKLAEITNLSNTPLPEDVDPSKAQEQRITRVNKLVDDYNELNGKLLDTMSKSQAGKAKADQIRAQLASLPRPEKLKWKAYTPTMVQGGAVGKPVPPSKDPMGLFR